MTPVRICSLVVLLAVSLDYKYGLVSATSSPLSHTPSAYRIPTAHSVSILSSHSLESSYLVTQIMGDLRGGGEYYDDDEYDEYDSEEEEEEERPMRGQSRKSRYDHNMIDPSRARPRQSGPPRGRSRGKKSSSSLSAATNAASAATKLATKSLSVTGNLAWNALVKQPGKLAFHVIRPKHVDLGETFGLWRLDQQVIEKSNSGGGDQRVITSVATIEFSRPPPPKGRPRRGLPPPPLVIVRRSGEKDEDKENVYRAPYTFQRKNKYLKGASLSSFQTSFVAPAFLVGENQTRLYGYKGTWQRKLADKSVIKLKGKIYQVHKQKFGKKRGEYVYGPAVGTFVMRRRISVDDDLEDEDYDDDDEFQYDEEDEEYSEGEY